MRARRPALLLAVVAAVGATVVGPPVANARGPLRTEPSQSVVVRVADAADAPAVAAGADATTPDGSPVERAPVVALEVTPTGLAQLQADPRVASVLTRGATASAALAESVPLVGAPSLWSGGHTGAGKVIAVIDTGVNPAFGGTLVGQACFAATLVPSTGELIGHCGPSADEEQAFSSTCFSLGVCDGGDPYYVPDADAGRPCPNPPDTRPSACAHGSAVAAVAARHDAPQGVAPDAGVYAIRVFDPRGAGADLVDVYYALDHVAQLADAGMDVVAVNLSLATPDLFSTVCDTSPSLGGWGEDFADAFLQLRNRGIATTIASGNDGVDGRIAFPACVSTGVSVGATDLDDDIAPFSDVGPGLDLLAPGADNGSSPLSIPSGTGFSQWAGTSFSAPHAAGAYTLMDELYPKASVIQRTKLLQANGVPVSSYRRLLLEPPTQALNAQILFPAEAPIAGTSRAAVGDFDGDGHADVLAHGPGSAPDRISYGGDVWSLDVHAHTVTGSYTPVVGNFRGTVGGPDDILWYAPGSAADAFWTGQPDRHPTSSPLSVNGTYTPSVGDFDGDGWDDVFWYAAGAAGDFVWYGGATGFTSRAVAASGTWRVAVGDFDGDGRDDVLFHAPGSAADAVWRGTTTRGTFATSAVTLTSAFTLVVANVDGDGDDDVVLYQPGSGSDYLWRGGPGVGSPGPSGGFAQSAVTINGAYAPVAGDLDDDGDDEILWYAAGTASDTIWFGRPAGNPLSRPVTITGTYTPLVGDLDADDGDDLVFFSSTSLSTPIWWSYVGAP